MNGLRIAQKSWWGEGNKEVDGGRDLEEDRDEWKHMRWRIRKLLINRLKRKALIVRNKINLQRKAWKSW